MNQDFINWLNSENDNDNNNTSQEANLLVVPVNAASTEENIDEANEDSQTDSQTLQTQEEHKEQPEQPEPSSEIKNIIQELRALRKEAESLQASQDNSEPPPETWNQDIDHDYYYESDSDIDSDSESQLYEHYEQGIDFQEYNDRTPHGTNFTRRLQKILHERKERAAEQRQREEEQRNHHPYIMKAILLCLSLIIALLFAWGVLSYLQKKAVNFSAPNIPEAQLETIKAGGTQTQTLTLHEEQEQKHEHKPELTLKADSKPITPPTFEDYLREGNNAFNLGVYNSATKNFFRALELDENDTRPYIGLSASWRAKGLFFDSKRILDDALMIFRKDPTIETALKILKGDSNNGKCKRDCSK